MSTPSCRTSNERASAWACAAMDRKPCGPPSHRHQISGPSSARERRMTRPGVGEPTWPDRVVVAADVTARERRARRPGLPPSKAGHQLRRAQQCGARGQDRSPWIALGVVDHERAPLVAVTLPRRPAGGIQDGGSRHRASAPGAAHVGSDRA